MLFCSEPIMLFCKIIEKCIFSGTHFMSIMICFFSCEKPKGFRKFFDFVLYFSKNFEVAMRFYNKFYINV